MSKRRGPRGVNTFGQPIVSHVDAIEREYAVYMKVMEDVNKYLLATDVKGQSKDWMLKTFAYLSIKPYCKVSNTQLIPAEFGIVVFSVEEGIKEIHSAFFEPGELPFLEKGEAMLASEINAYPLPGENYDKALVRPITVTPSNFKDVIINLAKKYSLFWDNKFMFFAARHDIPIVNCCLQWVVCKAFGEKQMVDSLFQIISFEILVKEMSCLKGDPEENPGVCEHEGGAGRFIYDTRYEFNLQLGCGWHVQNPYVEKLDRCTQSIACIRVYNALFYLCHLFQREITPSTHVPPVPK